jgi:ATP-dependent protease ClpP protease subunit
MLFTKNADGSVDLSGDIGDGYYDENWNYIPRDPALALLENFLIEQKGKQVEVTLTSDGGGYFTGQVFSSLFIRHGGVNLTLRGSVASAATLMLISANKVRMYGGASIMIHRVQGGGRGTGEQLIKMGEFYQQLDRTVVSAYVDAIAGRGKLINNSADETTKKVKKMYDAETWITAQDALDLGFVDEILTAQQGYSAFVPFNKAAFKPVLPTEKEETEFLRALAAHESNDVANAKELSILQSFKEFAQTVRAHKKAPETVTQNGMLQEVLGAIKQGFKDSVELFFPKKAETQPEPTNISNQSNQNPESEMTKEEIQAMLDTSTAALKAQFSTEIETLKTEKIALEQKFAEKERAVEAERIKAAADQKAIEDEQARLREENTRQQNENKPTNIQTPAIKKGERVAANATNFATVLATAHPDLYARLTQTGLPNELRE